MKTTPRLYSWVRFTVRAEIGSDFHVFTVVASGQGTCLLGPLCTLNNEVRMLHPKSLQEFPQLSAQNLVCKKRHMELGEMRAVTGHEVFTH